MYVSLIHLPQSGRLEAGQSVAVTIRYKHALVDIHDLPLSLEIVNGFVVIAFTLSLTHSFTLSV